MSATIDFANKTQHLAFTTNCVFKSDRSVNSKATLFPNSSECLGCLAYGICRWPQVWLYLIILLWLRVFLGYALVAALDNRPGLQVMVSIELPVTGSSDPFREGGGNIPGFAHLRFPL